ncbi:hypothetical protein L6164_012257 [Bauhinia variegata]|uniref:Uncharacterized protein n=1 Tax=Bauhinia variegata TaxID=167791 RepID=A0ACB9PAY0_BAUVA|nr:hypothetical protein L6164_012257 [Bauhinia variegata]
MGFVPLTRDRAHSATTIKHSLTSLVSFLVQISTFWSVEFLLLLPPSLGSIVEMSFYLKKGTSSTVGGGFSFMNRGRLWCLWKILFRHWT